MSETEKLTSTPSLEAPIFELPPQSLTPKPPYFNRVLSKLRLERPWFWSRSTSSRDLEEELYFASKHSLPILIHGESGTGKELVAQALHALRVEKLGLSTTESPWVPVNSASIPEELAVSLLFGHERGAFTSARDRQYGKFELARKGTLFLDEIQNLSLSVQGKLLRALQHNEVDRLGSNKAVKINCQTLLATNMPIEKLVHQGLFREDLFFRINLSPISLTPLRYRKQDIPEIAVDLLQQVTRTHQLTPKTISENALKVLVGYTWPGNLRELEHALLYAAIRTDHVIDVQHLRSKISAFSLKE